MDEEESRRFLLEITRLNGAVEEIQERLHHVDAALGDITRRLFMAVVIAAIGFAALFGCIAAIYLSSLF